MKKTVLLLALLMSANSFALVCESEENPGKKLQLVSQPGPLISGQIITDKTEHLFVGKKNFTGLGQVTYDLFNQLGTVFTFTYKKEVVFNHCRTRVCNPLPLPSHFTGKLSTQGLEDEYFTCL